ncbi:TPA: uroporphyrinogen-III C-methyltransferase [Proteus mirabilis]|uniref:Siroheme synthase n=1 Tax=Proteus mirabilis TaxID=584 RepID=A0AAN3YXG0_PROMI|nr:siroheme synthase CysG [Proteus mirabilis]EBN0091487.1 uroporphyrinogen-III C-methyltransferase [Salmonella enterica subsp. enterica serovar Virchow]ASB02929.1 uroporphyrinogen-III C-methyltransferase [Proteus mirabilis]EKU8118031.1 uroporphyrinogen-III C-methyltransferase [Proteus mirabilis]EKV9645448.1 uroporphyrinogen-III C-methyltransferase [Proteus mirabilis]EKW9777527.1 uroporphyrinogen-III C-methyltransferase [Proteus mirabilis]
MDYLPLFVELKQRPVLLVGGGHVAARKAVLLLKAGARLRVIAPQLCDELHLAYQQNQIEWIAGQYQSEYLLGMMLVIVATDDKVLNQQVYLDAQARHIFVNVVDSQPQCSFIFPAIIDRNPILIAISSAGKAPVLVRMIREKLEALLPTSLGTMATIAGKWRNKVKQKLTGFQARCHFWEQAFSGKFASLVASGQLIQAQAQLEQQLSHPDSPQGELALVGAGPGDAGLLTLRGLQVIQQAEVVLYDSLVSADILELVRRDADRICVGKRAGQHSTLQEEINQLIVKYTQLGKRVVRLKGGDPFIFGRGGEELEIAVQHGIPFQVVPGVTAASGASAYAGIPLTHRNYAQSVTFMTGHCQSGGIEPDWQALAQANHTLAIYMGTTKAELISQRLIEQGRSPLTPIAVISCGTRHDQQILTGNLTQLAQLAKQAPTPALLIVGEVAALHHQLAWFGDRQTQHTSAIHSSLVHFA